MTVGPLHLAIWPAEGLFAIMLTPHHAIHSQEADDEEYDRTARSNSIAEHGGDGQRASVAETPTLDLIISEEDIQGFHSKFTDKVRTCDSLGI